MNSLVVVRMMYIAVKLVSTIYRHPLNQTNGYLTSATKIKDFWKIS